MKELLIRAERCLGCRSCELACAVEHATAKNLLSAIQEKPLPQYRVQVTSDGKSSVPLQCRNCEDAPCLNACLTGALQLDARGIVLCDSDLCIGCWMCIMVCPFGVISQNNNERRIVKCDRCPEREIPACVTACPSQALVYREINQETQNKRRNVLNHLQKTPLK